LTLFKRDQVTVVRKLGRQGRGKLGQPSAWYDERHTNVIPVPGGLVSVGGECLLMRSMNAEAEHGVPAERLDRADFRDWNQENGNSDLSA
jgi:hypothetical protein